MPAEHPPASYCPHDIAGAPAELGLRSEVFETAFGAMHLVLPRHGRRGDAATLFLHGVGGSWRSWTPVLREAARQEVSWGASVLVDLPGFGASENRQRHLEAGLVGEELMRVMRRAGYTRVDVVGHSMGGFLALDLACRRPFGLRSVAVLSGAYYSIVDTVQRPVRAFARNPGQASSYLAMALLARLGGVGVTLASTAHRKGLLPLVLRGVMARPGALRPSVLEHLAKSVHPTSFVRAARNGLDYGCSERWGRISVPVWAGFGEEDTLVPLEDKARLEADLPQACTVTFPDAGHFSNLEQPGKVVAALDAFYAGLAAPEAGKAENP